MQYHHQGTKILPTQRLILRPFQLNDTVSVHKNWMSDPDVQSNYGEPASQSIEETIAIVDKWIASYQQPSFYRWAIIHGDSGSNIGQIAYYIVDDKHQKVDVEYCIGRSFWGCGYATEALKAVIHYAFCEIGFNRVQGAHRSANMVSGRVMQKAGMRYEGCQKQAIYKNGDYQDWILYGITRDVYIKSMHI